MIDLYFPSMNKWKQNPNVKNHKILMFKGTVSSDMVGQWKSYFTEQYGPKFYPSNYEEDNSVKDIMYKRYFSPTIKMFLFEIMGIWMHHIRKKSLFREFHTCIQWNISIHPQFFLQLPPNTFWHIFSHLHFLSFSCFSFSPSLFFSVFLLLKTCFVEYFLVMVFLPRTILRHSLPSFPSRSTHFLSLFGKQIGS